MGGLQAVCGNGVDPDLVLEELEKNGKLLANWGPFNNSLEEARRRKT